MPLAGNLLPFLLPGGHKRLKGPEKTIPAFP